MIPLAVILLNLLDHADELILFDEDRVTSFEFLSRIAE